METKMKNKIIEIDFESLKDLSVGKIRELEDEIRELNKEVQE